MAGSFFAVFAVCVSAKHARLAATNRNAQTCYGLGVVERNSNDTRRNGGAGPRRNRGFSKRTRALFVALTVRVCLAQLVKAHGPLPVPFGAKPSFHAKHLMLGKRPFDAVQSEKIIPCMVLIVASAKGLG
jgi:hypothetical protein